MYVYLNKGVKIDSGTSNCFNSSTELQNEKYFINEVNLNTLPNSKSRLEIQLKDVKTHRFVGPSCHLSLILATKDITYLNLTVCVFNEQPKNWIKASLNTTSLTVAKKGQSLALALGSSLDIYETDSILITFPQQIVVGMPE
jgi:hypothetical protein